MKLVFPLQRLAIDAVRHDPKRSQVAVDVSEVLPFDVGHDGRALERFHEMTDEVPVLPPRESPSVASKTLSLRAVVVSEDADFGFVEDTRNAPVFRQVQRSPALKGHRGVVVWNQ